MNSPVDSCVIDTTYQAPPPPTHRGDQVTSRLRCDNEYPSDPINEAKCVACNNKGIGSDNDWYKGSLTCGP